MKTVEELAREAGGVCFEKDGTYGNYSAGSTLFTPAEFEKFAHLIREALVQELIGTDMKPRFFDYNDEGYTEDQLAGAVLRERERCAQVCEFGAVAMAHKYMRDGAERCAAAIRSRDEH